jgi:DNA-binding NtrC family response regulator
LSSNSEITIVDDDPSFSFMLKDYLMSAGQFECQLYTTGDAFLRDYHSGDNRRIILDYEFTDGLNGLEVLKRIKEINPRAMVIVVSAQDDLEKAIEMLRRGAADYFLKTNKTVFANILCSLAKISEMERNKLN